MKVTYIYHSSFAVELEKSMLIFDYYGKGDLPERPAGKQVYFLNSHSHPDHFSKTIFNLREQFGGAEYVLAREIRLKPEEKPKAVLTVGDLTFDTEAHSASVRGKPLTLTNKEYELLLFLAKHPNQVFGREDLYELIWGLESMGDNITVAVHINRLREKVELDPSHPQMIQTVWGVGYRLNAV